MEPIERIRICRILEKIEQLPECSKRLGIRNTSHETRAGIRLHNSGQNIDLRNGDKE